MKSHLTPRELAQAVGVSESSVKRWADDGRIVAYRTAGGHRRIHVADAIRFIRSEELPLAQPEILGLTELQAAMDEPWGRKPPGKAILDGLRAGYAVEVRGMVLSLYLRGTSVAEICDGPLAYALGRIGEQWREDASGIFLGHQSLDLCAQALHRLRALLTRSSRDGPVAVGGVYPGDLHTLPSLMAAASLADLGWRVTNLSGQSSLEVLGRAAEHHRARLAWLAMGHPVHTGAPVGQIGQLADRLADQQARLVLGGRAWSELPCDHDNCHYAGSMKELVALAREQVA